MGAIRFGLLNPEVVDIDKALAKRAGELLASTGGNNTIDALVVAVAEDKNAAQIYSDDVNDVEELLAASRCGRCEVVEV
jgi:hypothetical protein